MPATNCTSATNGRTKHEGNGGKRAEPMHFVQVPFFTRYVIGDAEPRAQDVY
jgi:hypothetical protein